MQQPSSDNRASAWKSLYADCCDWCRFAEFRAREEGMSRLTAQQAGSKSGVTGQREPVRLGPIIRRKHRK
jgi:hypothetical protein